MNKKTEAKCRGAMLIVGFHAGNPPLIWRFDLERNHSFTLSLQGEEGDWELGITSPKGDFYPIVHFLTREDAEEALAKVEKALSGKRGGSSLIGKTLLALAGLAAFVVFAVVAFGFFVSHGSSSRVAGAPAVIQEGVPMSADDVLKPPR